VTLARPTLRIATYNVHSCRGLDRRTRPERTAAVLRDIDADIVALQEVIGPGAHTGGHAEEWARRSAWDG
jgi:Metal-dependent hydrolase